MFIEPKQITLKNGQEIVLKSPELADAAALLDHMHQTSAETHFMVRYPEEIEQTGEIERLYLKRLLADPDEFFLSAFLDGELVGNASINRVRDVVKCRHRGMFGISIKEKVCNLGLGSVMLKEVLELVLKTGLEQIELSVFSDNLRARHLYEKMGFVQIGAMPHAYRLKDGTYCDEIHMVYFVNREER